MGFHTYLTESGKVIRKLRHSSVKKMRAKLRRWEKEYPTEDEIKEYLAGNLCRCSGYEGQLRGIQNFLAWKKAKQEGAE